MGVLYKGSCGDADVLIKAAASEANCQLLWEEANLYHTLVSSSNPDQPYTLLVVPYYGLFSRNHYYLLVVGHVGEPIVGWADLSHNERQASPHVSSLLLHCAHYTFSRMLLLSKLQSLHRLGISLGSIQPESVVRISPGDVHFLLSSKAMGNVFCSCSSNVNKAISK
ncbi:hypothetical protein SISSUDRAFT_925025 [Sistotremastrum suecicum HHB10207 ss-3]|uniref:Uncharacterized protein n=1 Tax=Sistotremastrum suecicum HHB10207 ss-3 TaxID=1314776 RepID=A0A165WDQ9_9AGAM|nr:hypothetical protein SISSUDRAFT_925025 [Sistotremastrum suecicum HHB10207 ss-3]